MKSISENVFLLMEANRYASMDYCFNGALKFFRTLTLLLLIYDIVCQYSVNLRARFARRPKFSIPKGMRMQFGIGQFHVHGHEPRCFPRFSPNFILGAGVQGGETLEPLWDPLNDIGESTRGMVTSHRREVIDDHMNDNNWMKTTRTRW